MRSSVLAQLVLLVSAVLYLAPAECLSQTPPESHTVSLNGAEVYYQTVGEGDPLVLLHGFLATGKLFDPVLEDFARNFQVIIPDLRGHGGSTNPSGEFTMRQSAKDVFALLDHLGHQEIRGVGISTGAMTLLHMATEQPARVKGMVLIGSASYYPLDCRERLRQFAVNDSDWEEFRQIHRHGDAQIEKLIELFASFADDYEDMSFTAPWLSTIQAKTLIVHGDQDWCFPVSMATEIYEAIPDSALWVIPGGGHVPVFGDWRTKFTDVAVRFLEGS